MITVWLARRRRVYGARRTRGLVVCIAVAAAFLCATLTFIVSARQTLVAWATAPLDGADVVAQPRPGRAGEVGAEWVTRLAGNPAVAAVHPVVNRFSTGRVGGRVTQLQVMSVSADPRLQWFDVADGGWPSGGDEVVVDQTTGLRPGDRLQLDDPERPRTVMVSGVTRLPRPGRSALVRVYALPAFFDGSEEIRYATVRLAAGAQLGSAIRALDVLVGPDIAVLSAESARAQAVADSSGGTEDLQLVFAGLAAAMLGVCGVLICSIFAVQLARRRRGDALLRLVGARRSQVFRSAMVEGLLLSLPWSAAGALLGAALGWATARLLGQAYALRPGLVWPIPVVVALTTGVTLVAIWWPSRASAGVPVAAALTDAPDVSRPLPRRRVVVGGLMALAGVAGLVGGGWLGPGLPVVVVGGILAAVGLVVALPAVLTALLAGLDRLLPPTAVTARLAVANLRRSPVRAVATVVSVGMTCTLVVALLVGATSASVTLAHNLEARFPVDVSVSFDKPPPASFPDQISQVPGVIGVRPLLGVSGSVPARRDEAFPVTVAALAPDLTAVTNRVPPDLAPQQVLLSPALARGLGRAEGDRLAVSLAEGGREDLEVVVGALGDANNGATLLVAPATFARFAVSPRVVGVWARTAADADRGEVSAQVSQLAEPLGARVGGSLPERAQVESLVGLLTRLGLALLAASVVLAVVGNANALRLSVVDRQRSIGVLRALGLTRRGLNTVLVWEAVLASTLALLLGTGLGVLAGLAVVAAAAPTGGAALVVPWIPLLVLALTTLLGSALAARSAAAVTTRIDPAAALRVP